MSISSVRAHTCVRWRADVLLQDARRLDKYTPMEEVVRAEAREYLLERFGVRLMKEELLPKALGFFDYFVFILAHG